MISQAEQLALSVCKRRSGDRLWCGSCHDPHVRPEQPVEYFRARCLTCHESTLNAQHAALADCIGCHMVRRPAKDGGHTAFTDHRISRRPAQQTEIASSEIHAWREPATALRDRNLALALVTLGFQNHVPGQVIQGYKMLDRLGQQSRQDPDVLTALGTILLTAKESGEATKCFRQALALRPGYAPYEVNLATALIAANERPEAIRHLDNAVSLDPLLQKAVSLLVSSYRSEGEEAKATEVEERYRIAMGFSSSK